MIRSSYRPQEHKVSVWAWLAGMVTSGAFVWMFADLGVGTPWLMFIALAAAIIVVCAVDCFLDGWR